MSTLDIDAIAASTVLIRGTDVRGNRKSGTGYVVARGIVATCDHVVRDMLEQDPITLCFDDGREALATRLAGNADLDSALLSFECADGGPPALTLGGRCTWKANFDCWGFSAYAKGEGLSLCGVIGRQAMRDDQGHESIELDCNQAAAANGTPMHGFSGSPVVVDGRVVGHVKRFLSDPTDKLRPAFGKIYAAPSDSVHALLKQCNLVAHDQILPAMDVPPARSVAAKADVEKLNAMLASSRADRLAREAFELQAAESLIQLGAPSDAVEALRTMPTSLRNSQLMALGLAKAAGQENLDEAFEILDGLGKAGHHDAETAGILGGRYKDLWRESGQSEHLRKSHGTYLQAFQSGARHPYPGINAAATALWLGNPELARHLAREVLDSLHASPPSARDAWHLATEAEARLLLGDRQESGVLYIRACIYCDHAPGIVDTIERQLNRHEDTLGLDRTTLPRQ